MKRRARRKLERWEYELIDKLKTRKLEVASLNRLASDMRASFKSKVIRRRKQASSIEHASKLDSVSSKQASLSNE